MSNYQHHIFQLRATRTAMLTEAPTEDESRIVGEHFHYLMELAAAGKIGLIGRTVNNDETTFGLVLINSGTETDAREIMENDPVVKEGVMTGQLFPFRQAFPTDS